jgi:hypothetical protein
MGVSGQHHTPAALYPRGRERVNKEYYDRKLVFELKTLT